MEYTRITPAGEEKCSLLDGDGMTSEEMKKKVIEYCDSFELCGVGGGCILRNEEGSCIAVKDGDAVAYNILVNAGVIKPPVNFIKANSDDEVKQADDAINSGLADSGTRREFASGAVRDVAEGKGDMASLPWAAILRLSKHYEAGAKKYARWNYLKGINVSSFIDSACRHLAKYQCGCDDEDHLAAAAFNVLGAMQMEAMGDMQDLPYREGKNTFNYFECGELDGFSDKLRKEDNR